MEWNQKLQTIIDYVDNHLQRKEEPIDPQEIIKIADCSYSFFLKVFSYMNKISFAEYVRYRKLTLAGYDLKSTNMKVIDISYKYGYESPTSFTKAFQQFHGISPNNARKCDAKLQVFPKMQINYKQHYSWQLKQMPAFECVGKSISISDYKQIPAFWNECQRNGDFAKMVALDEGQPQGLFGFIDSHPLIDNQQIYSIMVQSTKNLPNDFHRISIPKVTWAIFDCYGVVPQAIQNGWKFLNEEWLIKYPFKHAKCPELEWYSDGNSYSEDYLSQIWIPIIEEEKHGK